MLRRKRPRIPGAALMFKDERLSRVVFVHTKPEQWAHFSHKGEEKMEGRGPPRGCMFSSIFAFVSLSLLLYFWGHPESRR